MFRLLAIVVSLSCLVALGCGGGTRKAEATYPVSGTVTLDQQPLPDGDIYFWTKAKGDFQRCAVKGGKFQGQAAAGNRRVEIRAYRPGKPIEMPGAPPEQTTENYIPARYNDASELTANVTPSGPNQFSFDLSSK